MITDGAKPRGGVRSLLGILVCEHDTYRYTYNTFTYEYIAHTYHTNNTLTNIFYYTTLYDRSVAHNTPHTSHPLSFTQSKLYQTPTTSNYKIAHFRLQRSSYPYERLLAYVYLFYTSYINNFIPKRPKQTPIWMIAKPTMKNPNAFVFFTTKMLLYIKRLPALFLK